MDKKRLYNLKWREKNRDRIIKYSQDYRRTYAEQIKENSKKKWRILTQQQRQEKLKYMKMWRKTESGKLSKKRSQRKYMKLPSYALENKMKRVKRYNITLEKIDQILLEQDNKCAICRTVFLPTRTMTHHVDHNHDTNKVRGLLCNSCNLIIAHCKESKFILESSISYLKKWEKYLNGEIVEKEK